jgi:hypothetical protein
MISFFIVVHIHNERALRIYNIYYHSTAPVVILLKPTDYMMHQKLNIQKLYIHYLCVYIYLRTPKCATYTRNWSVFITNKKSVYSAVRIGYLNKAVCASSLKGYTKPQKGYVIRTLPL